MVKNQTKWVHRTVKFFVNAKVEFIKEVLT